jgi:hypothetical protein
MPAIAEIAAYAIKIISPFPVNSFASQRENPNAVKTERVIKKRWNVLRDIILYDIKRGQM